MELKLTSDLLIVVAAGFMSLVFSYLPWVADWYYRNNTDVQRLIMLGALLVVTAVVFLMGCYQIIVKLDVPCTEAGIWTLVRLFFEALIANQSVDRISPKVGSKARVSG